MNNNNNNNNNNNLLAYLIVVIFIAVGVYLTFFANDLSKYDSEAKAYKIYENMQTDTDNDTIYYPIYYFKVKDREYECKSNSGSSSYPNKNKNTVYYDSSNPTKCKTEYDKSNSKVIGIIFLAISAFIIIALVMKKPNNNLDDEKELEDKSIEVYNKLENVGTKAVNIMAKVQLVYKRIILGIIIAIIFILTLIDATIFKQTIISRHYIQTTAKFVEIRKSSSDISFNDGIYTFTDSEGKNHEVVITIFDDREIKDEIQVRYKENEAEEYYVEGQIMDAKKMKWFIIKVVALVILIILFFNKKILSYIQIH